MCYGSSRVIEIPQQRSLKAKKSHSTKISQHRDLTAKKSHKGARQQRDLAAKRSHGKEISRQKISQQRDLTGKKSHSKGVSQQKDRTAKRCHGKEISRQTGLTANLIVDVAVPMRSNNSELQTQNRITTHYSRISTFWGTLTQQHWDLQRLSTQKHNINSQRKTSPEHLSYSACGVRGSSKIWRQSDDGRNIAQASQFFSADQKKTMLSANPNLQISSWM